MTQLIDKMKVLRKKNSSIKNFTGSGYYNQQGFNQALDKCIALAKAEASVVGDWERKYRQDRQHSYGSLIPFEERIDSEVAFIHTLLDAKAEAVVGDWEAEFDKIFTEVSCECGARDMFNFREVKDFITTLLDAKDREIAEAYKKGFIDGGLSK
jgi:hypothetical protein